MSDAHGLVLFDLDGTLVDSAPDMADALDATIGSMAELPATLDRMVA